MKVSQPPRVAAGESRACRGAGFRHGLPVTTLWSGLLSCVVLTAGLVAGCGSPPAGVDDAEILPVELPDLSGMHESVQEQLRDAHRALESGSSLRPGELADAYGRLGMLLVAGEYFEAAEACLLNARRLAPERFRWAYYLGHLYERRGDLEEATEAFERAHDQRPRDFATLFWLINVNVDLGRWDAVQPLLERARALQPASEAMGFQLGRAALAAGDHAAAVDHLEAVLRQNPAATIVHYPLGMAYRGLGDLETARQHLDRSGGRTDGGYSAGVGISMSDPLLEELRNALRSPQRHRTLALQADANGDREEAARQFRLALELEPGDADLQLSLGMALDRAGHAREALVELEAALRLDPRSAQANYMIGTILERAGRDAEAMGRYAAAAELAPESVEAQLRLADAYNRAARGDEALAHYRHVLEGSPDSVAGRFGEAVALVRLGRHREARDRLAGARERHPGQPVFAMALARLLAASPDPGVRNGRGAASLAETLVATVKTTAAAETMAMALAEVGQFAGAAEWQRLAIDVARDAGRSDLAQPMSANLASYMRGEPSRTPWRDDEPEFRPGLPVEPGLLGR